jgi:hypothetical protein
MLLILIFFFFFFTHYQDVNSKMTNRVDKVTG